MSRGKYSKKQTRSRRKVSKRGGRVVGAQDGEIKLALKIPSLLAAAHGAVEALAGEALMRIIKALIDEEVEQLAGKRYGHDPDRDAVRFGQEEGFVVFGGKKVPLQRPRVRAALGSEMPLKRYSLFQAKERSQKSICKKILRGVSTRNWEGAIDDICDGYGIQKSSVSRHWEAATAKELAAL